MRSSRLIGLSLALGILALLVLRYGEAGRSVSLNLDALAAMQLCEAGTGGLAGRITPRSALLFAAAARCTGSPAGAEAAYIEALRGPAGRAVFVRAAEPESLDLARALIQAQPENPTGYFWLGDILRLQSKAEAAIAAYRDGLARDPASADNWYLLGRLLVEAGDQDGALEAFVQACLHVDRGKNGCLNAAGLLFDRGRYEEAVQHYRQSLEQLPGYMPALRGAAESLLALGRVDEAIPYLQELAAQGDPEAAEKLAELGMGEEG